MYIDARKSDIIYHEPSQLDFEVNCAGYSVVEECDTGANRPNGMNDYLIIYIRNGCGHYLLNGELTTVSAGNAILYRPNEPQIYRYYQAERPQICWIHFSGTGTEALLNELDLLDKKIIPVANDSVLWDSIMAIIDEFTLKRTGFLHATEAYAKTAIINLARNSASLSKSKSQKAVEHICKKMQTEFACDTTNAEYAAECDMSIPHFLLVFKQLTGTSPHNYKLSLRIAAAKNMLINTEYKIVEISTIVGFKDSLYFCKYFKKETGFSPSDFRKNRKIDSQN